MHAHAYAAQCAVEEKRCPQAHSDTDVKLTGAMAMMAIPTIQVLLTEYGPEAPTLMGALNLAALNLANTLGAVGGSAVLAAGLGVLSTAWVGVLLI